MTLPPFVSQSVCLGFVCDFFLPSPSPTSWATFVVFQVMSNTIKAYVTGGAKVDGHVVYSIRVETENGTYTVQRRYSDFELLWLNVKQKLPPKDCPKFPRKHLVFNETETTINERTTAFNAILDAVLSAKFFQDDINQWAGPFLDPGLIGDDYRQSPQSTPGATPAPSPPHSTSPLSLV